MMQIIYLVRHSIRDTSIQSEHAPLTVEGIELAEALAHYFEPKGIKRIVASPYLRVRQTIAPTADRLGIPCLFDTRLQERKIGEWVEDFHHFSSQQWTDFDFCIKGGESLNQVRPRVREAFDEAITLTTDPMIIAGHGTALAVLINDLSGGNFGFHDFLVMRQPDIFRLTWSEGHLVNWQKEPLLF